MELSGTIGRVNRNNRKSCPLAFVLFAFPSLSPWLFGLMTCQGQIKKNPKSSFCSSQKKQMPFGLVFSGWQIMPGWLAGAGGGGGRDAGRATRFVRAVKSGVCVLRTARRRPDGAKRARRGRGKNSRFLQKAVFSCSASELCPEGSRPAVK